MKWSRELILTCRTCIYRKSCEKARDGAFCMKWRSKEPEEKREPDPNKAWERGEEAVF